MKIKDNTKGERLEKVIIKYFGKQKTLAEIVEVPTTSINNYVADRYNITKKFVMQLQTKAGINADYILNGNEPMMLDENRKPITIGDVPNADRRQDAKIINQRHFVLQETNRGRKEIFNETGEGNIAEIVFNDIREPALVLVLSNRFCKKYNIAPNSVLVVNRGVYDDYDMVLVAVDKFYYLAEFDDGILIDISDKKPLPMGKNTEIIGSVFSKIEKI